MSVSLAFVNARLWNPPSTCKSAPSHVSDVTMATALGICGDKINVIGSNSEVLSTCQDDTVVIDAKQGLLLPGITIRPSTLLILRTTTFYSIMLSLSTMLSQSTTQKCQIVKSFNLGKNSGLNIEVFVYQSYR